MNYGPLIYLAAFFALSLSWFGMVLTPQMQVGQLQQTNAIPSGPIYPVARPGTAKQGLAVYRANGCAACHSQQLRQTGTLCDVILNEPGTNSSKVIETLIELNHSLTTGLSDPNDILKGLPKTVLHGVGRETADAALAALKPTGAKAAMMIRPIGPDIDRGWGKRRSVAEDFLFDSPVMPGSQHIGPDLADVGVRRPDANWHFLHLYAPGSVVGGSVMPPYRFLFETHRIERCASPDALTLPAGLAPPPGYEVVPSLEARALVAYLQSLNAETPLFVAPRTPPPPPAATNATPAAAAAASMVKPLRVEDEAHGDRRGSRDS